MNSKRIDQSRIFSHRFLLSKTNESVTAAKKHSKERRIEGLDRKPFAYPEILDQEFPGLIAGSDFVTHALKKMEMCHVFGTIILQMDDFYVAPMTARKKKAWAILLDIGRSLEWVCRKSKGAWGPVQRNMFGCFFPNADRNKLETHVKRIKKKLAEFRKETVTIGLASYPELNFEPEQLIGNAQKALEHATFYGPNSCVFFNAVSLNISGDKYYQAGDIDAAIVEFETALEMDPEDINVHNSLGVCFGVLKRYDEALKEFEAAINLNRDEVMAVYNAGLVKMFQGHKEAALTSFLDACRIDNDIFEVVFQTGRIFQDLDQTERAIEYLEKAIQLNPNSGIAFRRLGECYMACNRLSDAMRVYKKAIKLQPNDAASLSAIGNIFETRNENMEIALTFYLQSVEISGKNDLYRFRLGRLYYKNQQYQQALVELKKARNLGNDEAHWYINQIETLQMKEELINYPHESNTI